jgi:hypothetical protein
MTNTIKKVVGFDSWTGGAHYFQFLLPAFAARSTEFTLVHIGSWGNEPDCPKETKIDDLMARDVSFYGGDSFQKILDIEKPDAVILLSTGTFAHRAFIRYCKQRSIPTLNLYHGLVNVQFTNGEMYETTVSRIAYVKYVLSRIGKMVRHTLPCYVQSLLKTKATYKDWVRFILDVFRLAIGKLSTRAADDAKTDKCAVYTPADIEHAMRCYGFRKDDVLAVGNPDLLHFGLAQDMLGSWVPPSTGIDKSIMYIETGFASVGLYYSGAQGLADHLINTSRSLSAQGYKLLVKLKPNQTYTQSIAQSLNEAGIELITNERFLTKLFDCSACIVETTSLAIVPALVGMPLLLAKYEHLRPLTFGKVLTSYPRGYLLQDISDVSDILLKDERASDSGKLSEWIDLNVGPLPPEKMPERVVDIIDKMINDRQLQEACGCAVA